MKRSHGGLLLVGSLGGILVLTMVWGVPSAGARAPERTAPQAIEAQETSEESLDSLCADCHASQAASLDRTPHHLLADGKWSGEYGGLCTSCHTGAEQHVEEGGGLGNIFAFGDAETAAERIQACQTCHASSHPRFGATAHAAAGLDCSSCHRIHAGEDGVNPPRGADLLRQPEKAGWNADRLGPATTTCAECHGDVLAQFEFNERHRLQEGILDCSSCHNPHEPSNRLQLGGFKQDACADCHLAQSGPFVFEHGSQRVEGCTACHSPHGSPNRHMLAFQRVAELCFSCHAAVPGFHSRFTLDTVCTNCHSTTHGSNFDPAFLK